VAVVQHEVEFLSVFEGVLHFDDERMVELLQDASLCLCMFDLVEFTYDLFLQNFHSVVLLRLFMQHE